MNVKMSECSKCENLKSKIDNRRSLLVFHKPVAHVFNKGLCRLFEMIDTYLQNIAVVKTFVLRN